ncbi:MAG: GntR family transcriptional regulator [Clostridia bacterium]|nr:GntR family transcriptional regulator [Clostridia bacterium]
MAWKFDPERPIYLQISERLTAEIVSGRWPAGTKVPTVRDLALDAGVNPNTAQRALSEMERDGYLETRRGDGRYVTERDSEVQRQRRETLARRSATFVGDMKALGFSDAEILEAAEFALKGDTSHE